MRQFFASVLEVLEVAAIAIGAVFLIRHFLVQPFLVSGSSMVPTFEDGNYLLIDELTFHFRAPERGEVIVFKYPKDTSTYFIKRIIGLPGERILINGGKVTVYNKANPQGLTLDETYLPSSFKTTGSEDITLGPSEYFMMGDNREASFDSRSWGPMPANDIVGLVRLRLWPLNDLTAFAAPKYQ
ncbi:MAG TPA: signal peptidase I [Candidatus Paceibacterota bacterium]|nr:signal peptidase I [Candidatus Paceibacterota bacterium]